MEGEGGNDKDRGQEGRKEARGGGREGMDEGAREL